MPNDELPFRSRGSVEGTRPFGRFPRDASGGRRSFRRRGIRDVHATHAAGSAVPQRRRLSLRRLPAGKKETDKAGKEKRKNWITPKRNFCGKSPRDLISKNSVHSPIPWKIVDPEVLARMRRDPRGPETVASLIPHGFHHALFAVPVSVREISSRLDGDDR